MTDSTSFNLSISAAIEAAEEIRVLPRDLKQSGLSQRDALLEAAAVAKTWRSTEGEAFATVPVNGHEEHLPIRSSAFRFWLRVRFGRFFTSRGGPAGATENAVAEACSTLEARAMVDGPVYAAPLRIGEIGNALYIDLGRPEWDLVEITGSGWTIVPTSPAPIIRGRRPAPFPAPTTQGNLGPLYALFPHLDEDTRILLVAWCIGALMPRGPYPILVLGGEQGSGKSTITRILQRLTDPVEGDVLPPPTNDRDLTAMAKARRVLAFDNVSDFKPAMADCFCRLSTGSEIGGRALFTDHDAASFRASRPIILNGISGLTSRADLADRAIVVQLPRLPNRSTVRDLDEALEKALPSAFAALLDAISFAMKILAQTPVPAMRMADFGRVIVAAEPTLKWSSGTFLRAFERMRAKAMVILAEDDPVSREILLFMRDRKEWHGLKGKLFDELTSHASASGRQPDNWPRGDRSFSVRLSRAAPVLRELGIDVIEHDRLTIGRPVTLRRILPVPAFATLATSQDCRPSA